MTQSIDTKEVEKFSALAEQWWDVNGTFRPLHVFNPVRIAYIRDTVQAHYQRSPSPTPLQGLRLLDIGCGGGLLAEPMARLGAAVTAIDASEKNIAIASLHAQQSGLPIDYRCISVEALAASEAAYDVVLAMEVVEHVADVGSFLSAAGQLVKPGGLLFVATLNRTLKSYALAIVGAEYILRWVPKGTHDWQKFLKPSEIESHMRHKDIKLTNIQGVSYNPLKGKWGLSQDVGVNYMMVGVK